MPSNIIEARSQNRTTVVRANSAGLTRFDPIRNDPGARTTEVVRAGTPVAASVRKPADIRTSGRRVAVRTEGETGVALPRRSYAPQ